MCSSEVPQECAHYVPYTSYPNELFGLDSEEDYLNMSSMMEQALRDSNCTGEHEEFTWGVCSILFPRCLLGFSLYPCRQSCLGKQCCAREPSTVDLERRWLRGYFSSFYRQLGRPVRRWRGQRLPGGHMHEAAG